MAEIAKKLIDAMKTELNYQQSLAVLLDNKLDAMRHYDLSRLEALTENEQQMVQDTLTQENRCTDLARFATKELVPGKRGNLATASELARACREPQRSQLLSLAAMLKQMAEKVQRLNRINSIASEKILNHFDGIFRIFAQSGCDIGLYQRAGKKAFLEQNRLVDAIA